MFLYAVVLMLPALILAADPPPNLEGDLFKAMDSNSDGKISQTEFDNYFLGFDKSKDGSVDRDEFKDNLDKINPAFANYENALYNLLDRTFDGKVDKSDFDQIFSMGDFTGDGYIDRSEFSLAFAAIESLVG